MKLKLKPLVLLLGLIPVVAMASSHREAPFISTMPQLDASDFYMFRSYEPGHSGFIDLLANYNPLQDAYSGPNFHMMSDTGVYDIHIDNSGSAKSDITFRFKFSHNNRDLTVPAGGQPTSVPLLNIGPITADEGGMANLNVVQFYTLQVKYGSSANAPWQYVINTANNSGMFRTPVDNIGVKSIADYAKYSGAFVYNIQVPGCSVPGRVFVGQRKDGFVADLGDLFDLVNLNPLGDRDGTANALTDKNVTTLALEMPGSCLRNAKADPVIGGWTTSSIAKTTTVNPNAKTDVSGGYQQVSRLGSPLVNEVVIGLKDKDKFNTSSPDTDSRFAKYVVNPSLPVLLNVLFGAAVPGTPRNDLVSAFLTGVKGLNQPANVTPAEELRLNTTTAPTLAANQNDLGVLGGDVAGFPNGRRPYDDTIDIALRVVEGALCGQIGSCGSETTDPNMGAKFTDGARSPGPTLATEHLTGKENAADTYLPGFPYLNTPVPGSSYTPPTP